MSPAIPAATSSSRCTAGCGRRSRSRCMARRATCTRTWRSRAQLGVPQAIDGRERRHRAAGPRRRRRSSTRCRPAAWCSRTDRLLDADDDLYRTRRRLMAMAPSWSGLVLDRYGALLAAPQLSTFGAVDLEREPGCRTAWSTRSSDAIEDARRTASRSTTSGCARRVRGASRRALDLPRSAAADDRGPDHPPRRGGAGRLLEDGGSGR